MSGKITRYEYDSLRRLYRLVDNNGKELVSYSYDSQNRIKETCYGTGIVTSYEYDPDGNISRLKTVGLDELGEEKQVFQDYCYQYDGNGNRTSKEGLLWAGADGIKSESIRFIYDRKNQLVEESYGNQRTRYDYDPAGNRIWQDKDGETFVFTYNQKNQLTAKRGETGSYVYQYDKQGSLTEELCSGQKTTYHYDSLNRQTEVIRADGMFQRNRYDAEGLRAEMEENGRLCRFIFHKSEIVSEERTEEQPLIRYIRGYGAEYLEQDGKSYSIQKDEQNSTVFLLDRNHEIQGSYSYDDFGGFRSQSNGQGENRILYTGQQYDALGQNYYLRARFYRPDLGRFTQEDVYRGDGLNLYAYCQNNPVTYYDPTGYNADCNEVVFGKRADEDYVVSDKRRIYILDGDETGGGHGPNRGFPNGFPDTWTDDQVIAAVERVANNPNSIWKQKGGRGSERVTIGGPHPDAPDTKNNGNRIRFEVEGQDHGQNIRAVVEPSGEGIISGYPRSQAPGER